MSSVSQCIATEQSDKTQQFSLLELDDWIQNLKLYNYIGQLS